MAAAVHEDNGRTETDEQRSFRLRREIADYARSQASHGVSGITFFGGFVDSPNEFNGKFEDHLTYLPIYEQMRRSDGQVAAILQAVTLPVKSASWSVQPPKDATPIEKEIADFASALLFEIPETGFVELLDHLLTAIWAGFSVSEMGLRYDGEHIVVSRFAPRLASTIDRFEFDSAQGRVSKIHQTAGSGPNGETPSPMPRDKTIIVSFAPEADDPRGISILRAAYKHWFIKDQLYRVDAIRLERHAVPPLVVKLPENAKAGDKTAAEKIAKDYRSYERGFIVLPSGYEASVLDTKAAASDPGVLASIKHHDEMIARLALAQFLTLGTTETGARALGETFLDLFELALAAVAGVIARAVNRDVLEKILPVNFAAGGWRYPELRFEDLTRTSNSAVAVSVAALVQAGALSPDATLEDWIRRRWRLPDRQRDAEPAAPPLPPARPGAPAAPPPPQRRTESIRLAVMPREPNGAERFVAFKMVAGAMDDAVTRASDLTASARLSLVSALVEQVVEVARSGDPVALETIEAPERIRDAVSETVGELLLDVYDFGRRTVADELRRQLLAREVRLQKRVRRKTADPSAPLSSREKAEDLVSARSARIADQVVEPVVAAAKDEATAALRTRNVAPDVLRERLDEVSTRGVKAAVGRAVPEAFDLGRDGEARDRDEEIYAAVYSSLLDANSTCGPCSLADGTTVTVGSPRYDELSPPLNAPDKKCEGGDQCRCIWVYVLREDVDTISAEIG